MPASQCGDPACLGVCPTGAITKSETNGVVRINETKCLGCGLCAVICPDFGIYIISDDRREEQSDRHV
jgi:Fe-S-cluster-containing hydrogenase component 2